MGVNAYIHMDQEELLGSEETAELENEEDEETAKDLNEDEEDEL